MRSLGRFLIFVSAVALAVVGFYWMQRQRVIVAEPKASESRPVVVESRLPGLEALDREFTSLIEQVTPSVVSIYARQEDPRSARLVQLRRLLGMGGAEIPQQLGSGSIVSEDGLIVTNLHVIQGANKVDVFLSDGRSYPATVLGGEPEFDLAVLKIDAPDLRPLRFADSDSVKVGQLVFAIGNPLGLQETVTQGIISGSGRRQVHELATEFFQTDAAINPGNSGGPLVNLKGEIVGINTLVLADTQGISFAIPARLAERVVADVFERGRVIRPWIGTVGIVPVTPTLAAQLGLDRARGLAIGFVEPGSPAERAGLRMGDVLLEYNGKPLRDRFDLRNRLAESKAGDEVVLRVARDGQESDFRVRLAEPTVPVRR